MNVGLIAIDGKIPNLALMKISSHHKTNGDDVDLIMPSLAGNYDLVYASKIFSRSVMPALPESAIIGGSGSRDIKRKLPNYIDNLCPDYTLYDMNYSLGYFTRGCIRDCDWCIVREKEGEISAYAKVDDFIRHKKAVLLDNNVLAHPHGIEQIEALARLGINTDFNQGLDARLIDAQMAKLLSRIKWSPYLRLACDTQASKHHIAVAVEHLRRAGATPRRYSVYCLITNDIDDAMDRIAFLEGLKLGIFAQPYLDIEGKVKPSKIAKDLATWCNKPNLRKTIPFDKFFKYRNKIL